MERSAEKNTLPLCQGGGVSGLSDLPPVAMPPAPFHSTVPDVFHQRRCMYAVPQCSRAWRYGGAQAPETAAECVAQKRNPSCPELTARRARHLTRRHPQGRGKRDWGAKEQRPLPKFGMSPRRVSLRVSPAHFPDSELYVKKPFILLVYKPRITRGPGAGEGGGPARSWKMGPPCTLLLI